ncbi:MAG: NADH-quinone oxidoreductase subunit NuoH [Bdellovibrionales bacterium]|nr:NADH-quinone oxidoreductase subunit NuoH [Bdellovibrionales bacterium]
MNFQLVSTLAKTAFVLVVLLQVAPIMAWAERRICSWMQNRTGPNRVGPFGLLQSVADAVKFVFKEDLVPAHVRKWYYLLAPAICVIPAFMTFAVVPFGPVIEMGGHHVSLQAAELNVGFVFVMAVSSLAVYGIIVAAWASNNKYSMLGGLRSTAQMISYELAMGMSLVAILLYYNTVDLQKIAEMQAGGLKLFGREVSGWVPHWGIFLQPISCLVFVIAAFAETNRLPFDLPEGEAEIVAGYHLEYGGMKWSLFFMAEYAHMLTASGLFTTFFLGGWQMFPGMEGLLGMLQLPAEKLYWATVGAQVASFWIKVVLFMLFFIVIRFTLPRFRYDQLMKLGWKVLVPISLFNIVFTAAMIAARVY